MIDFLVVGGGVAGLSAAARLSELGSVTLVEAETALGYHTSGRSAALFEENYGPDPVVALSRASADFHREANGGYLSPRGFLLLGRAQDQAVFDADLANLNLAPVSVDDALLRVPILDPATVAFAAYHDGALDIDTDRLLQDLARAIRSNGGVLRTGAPVTAIRKSEPGWTVVAGDAIQCRVLVNAAGAWADQVAGLAGLDPMGITPYRRSMARIPAPGGHDVGAWPLIMGAGERWYAKPDAGKLLVSPADADPVPPQDAWADDMILAEGLARYEEMVTEPVTRVETNWAGLRSFSPDGVPVLGPDPDCPDFIWCAGQGGYGFQSAPAAARLLADLVGGGVPEIDAALVAALHPARFRT